MNQPGMNITTEEWVNAQKSLKGLTLWQIDLMSEQTRKRFFDKTLKKYTVKALLIALMDKGITLSDEQMQLLKEEG